MISTGDLGITTRAARGGRGAVSSRTIGRRRTSPGYKRDRAIPGKQIAGAPGIAPIEMSTTPPGHRRHHSRMETTDVSWREICGNEEELSLLFHHIEPDGVGAVGQATVIDGDLFAPRDCPAGEEIKIGRAHV